jgi:glycosyltransferase involved in cell wall biosynthesis
MIAIVYDNIGFSFAKVARLTAEGFESIGYRMLRLIPIHDFFRIGYGRAIVIYDTKLYERKHVLVRGSTRGKLIVWADSPADPRVINPLAFSESCHVTTLPYWLREYRRHGIPVCGWVPRPIDYDTAVKVAEAPRDELCRDVWARFGRYVFTVGSDNMLAPSKPPRKGLDAYDEMCGEIKSRHSVKCLYVGNWGLRNAVKASFTGGLSEYELMRLMRCSEVFVWPSRSEGFGMPPIEAMSVGSVVVSSNAPFNELVVGVKFDYTEEKSVYCAEAGFPFKIFDYDVRSLIDAVDYVLSMHEDEREGLRIKASEARELYRPGLVAQALSEV